MNNQNQNNRWAFPTLLIGLLIAILAIGLWRGGVFNEKTSGNSENNSTKVAEYHPADVPAGKKVELIVDFSDGHRWQHSAIAWKEGMTILDALNQASKHPRGLDFVVQGEGEKTLLAELDHVRNQGGSGADGKKNWLFYVNEKFISKSFAIYELKPADVILWKYKAFE